MPGPGGPVAPRPFDGAEALRYGFSAFVKNLVPFLVVTLVIMVVAGGLSLVGAVLDGGFDELTSTTAVEEPSFTAALQISWVSSIFNLLGTVVASVLNLGLLRMAFDVVDGRGASMSTMFRGYDVLIGVAVAVVVGLMTSVGLLLCIVPGVVVAVLMIFSSSQVVAGGAGFGEAISGSARMVTDNLGPVIIWLLLVLVLSIVIVCCTLGVGAIVVGPVVSLSTAYAYRTLRGEPVAQPV